MVVFILTIAAITFFLIGITIIFKSYKNFPEAKRFVPVVEFEKAQDNFDLAKKEVGMLRVQLDTLTKELTQAKENLEQAKKAEQLVVTLQSNEESCKARIQQLEQDISVINEKAEKQAQESLTLVSNLKAEIETLKKNEGQILKQNELSQSIEQLTTENQTLKKTIEEHLAKVKQLEEELASAKTQTKTPAETPLHEESLTKIKQMEEEFSNFKKKAETQAEEAAQAIKNLLEENEKLKELVQHNETQLAKTMTEIEHITQEKQSFQTQLNDALQKSQQQKEVKPESPAKEEAFPDQIKENQRQAQELRILCEELKNQLETMRKTVEDLRQENHALLEATKLGSGSVSPEWLEEKLRLEEQLGKLKEYNAFLIDKDKMMQKELTKTRAQAMGLEKILEDMKI